MDQWVQSVRGPIPAESCGLSLPHEHVMVDFIGAAATGPHRYKVDEVVSCMEPYLAAIRSIGVMTLIECTPMYLARDVGVLRRLSDLTGLTIITNTGQYKEPFLPERTLTTDPESLAAEWIDEFEHGIDDTDCKPGFIKTAVNPESLAPVQRTVISAAAITSRETGLPIATHTGIADAADEILDILESYDVDPARWIFVHAQNEEQPDRLVDIARRGAWIELDGLRPGTEERHLQAVMTLIEAGFGDSILLSHDAGWYRVGEPNGGEIRGYTHLFDAFIPRMRRAGIEDEMIRNICSVHPGRAFALRA